MLQAQRTPGRASRNCHHGGECCPGSPPPPPAPRGCSRPTRYCRSAQAAAGGAGSRRSGAFPAGRAGGGRFPPPRAARGWERPGAALRGRALPPCRLAGGPAAPPRSRRDAQMAEAVTRAAVGAAGKMRRFARFPFCKRYRCGRPSRIAARLPPPLHRYPPPLSVPGAEAGGGAATSRALLLAEGKAQ